MDGEITQEKQEEFIEKSMAIFSLFILVLKLIQNVKHSNKK